MENIMKTKSIFILSIVTLLLAAFTGPAFAAPARVTSASTISASSTSITDAPVLSASSYSPQPGDDKLIRDRVFLDLAKSRLIVSATRPVQVKAVISGNLPSPCHVLRVVVSPATVANVINISVYSLVKPGIACATVLQPFSVTVSIGTFTSGSYTVNVNGMKLGAFSAGSTSTTSVTTTP
jgi:hypothetical protein